MNRITGCYKINEESRLNFLKMTETLNFSKHYIDSFYSDDDTILNGVVFSENSFTSKKFLINKNKDIIIGIDGFIYNIFELGGNKEDDSIVELYEKYGEELFCRLNGQFSIVIIDKSKSKLILARDRFGQKPMFYVNAYGCVYFSSEINSLKGVLKNSKVDERCLRDICTAWSSLGDHTFYKDISSVECGSYISFSQGALQSKRYFDLNILQRSKDEKSEEELINELDILLNNSIKRRMNENEKLAFYLSGGLDSSLIAAIATKHNKGKINTFSISFEDKHYDETMYQDMISKFTNSNHKRLTVSSNDIIENIESIVKIIQSPIIKTGLCPMYLLSKFVKDNGFDAVLSGEGADEIFGGYDIYKEVKIREFCQKDPLSKNRPLLYKRLYPYVNGYGNLNNASLTSFFNQVKLDELFSSHLTRFKAGDYCYQFFSDNVKDKLKQYDYKKELEKSLPSNYDVFSNIAKAQSLEIQTFLNNYLLLLQGDCIAMSNGISCKYPFLDNDVTEFAFSLKDKFKINVLNEKYLLKKLASKYLPSEFLKRKKFPFRAPIDCISILENEKLAVLVAEDSLNEIDIFNSKAVLKFINSVKSKNTFSEREQMLLMFIVSVQLLGNLKN